MRLVVKSSNVIEVELALSEGLASDDLYPPSCYEMHLIIAPAGVIIVGANRL